MECTIPNCVWCQPIWVYTPPDRGRAQPNRWSAVPRPESHSPNQDSTPPDEERVCTNWDGSPPVLVELHPNTVRTVPKRERANTGQHLFDPTGSRPNPIRKPLIPIRKCRSHLTFGHTVPGTQSIDIPFPEPYTCFLRVGRNSTLILGLIPDPNGLMPKADVRRLNPILLPRLYCRKT